jgi:hypothetical protein
MNSQAIIYLVETCQDTIDLFQGICSDILVRVFADPIVALQAMVDEKPWVIVSRQMLSNMNGDEFLKISRQISPFSIRVLQTSQFDERLILDSIRKSQLNDFIKKPWEPDLMRNRMDAAIELYRVNERYRILGAEASEKDELIKDLSAKIQAENDDFLIYKKTEGEMRREIECWAPPLIVSAIKNKQRPTPAKQTIITLAFSIPPEVTLPDLDIDGRPLRIQMLRYFSDIIYKYGGWRESGGGAGGRITIAFFGLLGKGEEMADSALAAALEFKTAVENIYNVTGFKFPCYITIHLQNEIQSHIHSTLVETPDGPVTQKNFETFGIDYDTIKALKDSLKSTRLASIAISEKLKSCLKSDCWELTLDKPSEDSNLRNVFLVKAA